MSIHMNAKHLKYISLITLTLQNAILGLSMRYARTRPGDIFLSSTGDIYLNVIRFAAGSGISVILQTLLRYFIIIFRA